MKKQMLILAPILVGLLFFTGWATGGEGRLPKPLPVAAPIYEIQDLAAQLFSDENIIEVSGKIRNLGFSPARGTVIIYLKNGNDEVVHAVETEVNQERPFNHGESGAFDATINASNAPGVENVSIEFVQK